ncbi:YetF domain-containing protein [Mucilaginibacter humi]|uniref:YetF domain-containing protein n=1 Tax=Mucilaginibacter humi TaxID=2732510 RepID=UPI00374272C8
MGASPFVPIIVCCFLIVILHRGFSWLVVNNKAFGRFIEGDKILIYKDGHFISENMKRALLCEEDTMQGVRKSVLTEDMSVIDKIYMERNGEITSIKK